MPAYDAFISYSHAKDNPDRGRAAVGDPEARQGLVPAPRRPRIPRRHEFVCHAASLAFHRESALRVEPSHGGPSPGAPKGNKNAWKYGYYSAEGISMRRAVRALLERARQAS